MLEQLLDYVADDTEYFLFKVTPAHLRAMLNTQVLTENSRAKHVFIVGGEQLEQSTLLQWQQRLPHATFINEYGPTEATVGCSVYTAELNGNGKSSWGLGGVPIGKPINNAQLYVLDKDLNIQPLGIAGELCIAGTGLSRGYLNRAALTAEMFVPNPYSVNAGERLYKTGDLVRHLPSGELQYIGRIDEQVKIRGRRIELGEIEFQLTSLSFIGEAVVLSVVDNTAESNLIAYITLNKSELSHRSRKHPNSIRCHKRD